MKDLLLRLEPVIWVLFGAGIMLGTMLLTGWLLVVGLAAPLGIVSLDFDHVHAVGSHLLGRLGLLALIALPLWKGAHHMRHVFIDMGGGDRDAVVAPALYALAALGSLLALVAVVRL